MANNITNLKEKMEKGEYLLVFKTAWCPDCKMMQPIYTNAYNQLLVEFPTLQLIEIDAEEFNVFRDEKSDLPVLKVPSFFAVRDGEFRHIGYEYLPIELIILVVKEHFSNNN